MGDIYETLLTIKDDIGIIKGKTEARDTRLDSIDDKLGALDTKVNMLPCGSHLEAIARIDERAKAAASVNKKAGIIGGGVATGLLVGILEGLKQIFK